MADKSYQEGMTRSEASKALGVSVSSLRNWQKQFAAWLEVSKKQFGGGRQKAIRYSDNDMLVFATVKKLSGEGLRFEQIRERLDTDLATATFDMPEEAPEEEDEEPGVSLVPWNQFSAVVAQLQGAEGKLEAIQEERDYLRERIGELEEKLDTTQEQLIEEVKKSWWQKLRGR